MIQRRFRDRIGQEETVHHFPVASMGEYLSQKLSRRIVKRKLDTPVKLIVLLRPYLESNAEATAFLTSADISAAHLSPIDAFVPKAKEKIMKRHIGDG
jgi:hypothetical protein